MAYPNDPINATYKVYDGSNWVVYHFVTNAGQVNTTAGRKFLTTSVTVNSNTAGTTGAKVTVGSNDAANIEVDGAHITGQAVAYSGTLSYANTGTENALHIVAASDAVSTALGKLDKAVYKALTTIPTNVVTTDANGNVDLGNGSLKAGIATFGYESINIGQNSNYDFIFSNNEAGLKILSSGDLMLQGDTYKIYNSTSNSYENIASKEWVGTQLGTAAAKDFTTSVTSGSNLLVTSGAVASAIAALPTPMQFKGTLGTGGTVTSISAASSSNNGHMYKVIVAGTYQGVTAKIGDTLVSNGSAWVLIPSGDEPSGTVTSVGISNATNGGLSISGSPITTSGTITIGLANNYGDTKNPYAAKSAHYVLAGPASGSAAAPTFRQLTLDDINDGTTRKLSKYVPFDATNANNTGGIDIGNYDIHAGTGYFGYGNVIIGEASTHDFIYSNYEGGLCIQSAGHLDLRATSYTILNQTSNVQETIASQEWTCSNFSRVFIKTGSTAPTAPTNGFHKGDIWIN